MTIHTYINNVKSLSIIPDLCTVVNRYSFYTTSSLLTQNVKEGHLDIVKYVHEYGADINVNRNEAMYLASKYGHLDIVKYLNECGLTHNFSMLIAYWTGHLDIVTYLVECNDRDVTSHNNILVQIAADNGDLEMIKYLFKHGAYIPPNNTWTARLAEQRGYSDVVKFLNQQ